MIFQVKLLIKTVYLIPEILNFLVKLNNQEEVFYTEI